MSPPSTTPSPGVVLAVTGATGGAGTSLLAAALADELSTRGPTILLDTHFGGAGLEVLLGMEDSTGVKWPELHDARGALDWTHLETQLPTWRGVHVVTCTRTAPVFPATPTVNTVLASAVAAGRNVVVDAPASIVHNHHHLLTHHLVLAARNVCGVAGAAALAGLPSPGGGRSVVTSPQRPVSMTPQQVARYVRLPLAGEWPHVRGLAEAVEHGATAVDLPRGAHKAARRVVARLTDLVVGQERHEKR
ncbi:hypothetical protein [Jonesia quinghaiensis]|uniref:hypothetical protein n=1 Tax=Jonesia quinghaiensis TaxID=262806 RepID=UPI0003F82E37|nr:hypothetical protein [Jonesia quinghaiensis]